MNHLKPYPAYKDSGVPWLGEVPEHWNLRRTKTLLSERVQKDSPDEPLLAATQTKGVVWKDQYENRTVLALKDLHLLKLVRVGDFVISLRSFQGGIEYAREQGIISPAYTVLYPNQPDMHGFLAWLFKSKPYIENLSLHVTGIRQGQNIDYQKLCRSEIPLPPLPEQTAIVRYLDYMDKRMRRYINAKKKLIALLNEQKQAIIHHAVTRGLDPNVRLKPSGVEWLGDIPEHWEMKPLKQWTKINQDTLPENIDPAYEFSYMDIGSVGTGFLVKQPERMRFGNAPSRARRILHKNDTIVSTVRTYLKSVYFVSEDNPNLVASTGFAVLTPKSELVPEFFSLVIQDGSFVDRVTANSIGVAYPAIAETRLASLQLAIPPTEIEQQAITEYVLRETMPFTTAITCAQHEIDLLREYRTRLIADGVTGKLDVREAAVSLPEEAEQPEDIEELTDSEGMPEEVALEPAIAEATDED